MFRICMKKYEEGTEIALFAAAVADFSPASAPSSKIKKSDNNINISLLPTKDIAFEAGKIKKSGVIHIGFALETD